MIDQKPVGTEVKTENTTNEGETTMEKTNIQKLFEEVELYKQAIQDAEDALASAEEELDEALDEAYQKECENQ